jgi:hypothetical protein
VVAIVGVVFGVNRGIDPTRDFITGPAQERVVE